MTAITDKKLRDKLMKEKTLEMKKTTEMIKQNTYEKKNKKNTIPEALITTKEKQMIKEEPIQGYPAHLQASEKPRREKGKCYTVHPSIKQTTFTELR